MRRLIAAAALLALVVPLSARADADTTYGPASYVAGPEGGDQFNYKDRNAAEARITVVRANPQPGAFNCGGSGGFSTFKVEHPGNAAVARLAYEDALVDSFAWITLSAIGPDGVPVLTEKRKGPLVGSGSLLVAIQSGAAGPLTFVFGIEVASACPNVDGGTARFPSLRVIGY